MQANTLIWALLGCLVCTSALVSAAGFHWLDRPGATAPASVTSGSSSTHRTLQAVSLYCNATGSCARCRQEHMNSEACRPTGHAQKLTCMTDKQIPHEVVLNVRRHINTEWQPLHISRSCPAPNPAATATEAAAAAAAGGDDSAVTHHDIGEAVPRPVRVPVPQPVISSITQPITAASSSSNPTEASAASTPTVAAGSSSGAVAGGSSSEADKPHPRQVYFAGSSLTGVGGLNVLYFELGMLLLLSGSLPVLYIRKRRYVRL